MKATEYLPDKCDYCGLRVFYLSTESNDGGKCNIDNDFANLHKLRELDIIDSVPSRKISISIGSPDPSGTAFCAINSKSWHNKNRKCKHWTLKIRDAGISDYMAMHQASRNNLLALIISIVSIGISVAVAFIAN